MPRGLTHYTGLIGIVNIFLANPESQRFLSLLNIPDDNVPIRV